jgi:indole-3-glycerol phosphate synthase
METILDRIILEKKKEVQLLKMLEPTPVFKSEKAFSLIERLENTQHLAVIAEFKRASPSKGNINDLLEPAEQAKQYEQYGAAAVSVLTDSMFFKGSFQDLQKVRESVNLPLLCKDFIIDKIQIDFAKKHGANLILLIAAALNSSQLAELYDYALQQNLEVLMEVHDEEDLEKAFLIKPRLYGINNRNLKTFEVDLAVTERLAPRIHSKGGYVISESGIFSHKDAKRVSDVGVKGVLVGEALMRSQDLSSSLQELMVPTLKEVKR